MMYNGSWPRPEALIDCGPRRITCGAVPGRPDDDTMLAPGTLPWSCESGFDPGTGISSAPTWATVNGNFFTSVAPVTPVTTTWLRRLTSCFSSKSTVCAPAAIVIVRTIGT